jgi:hypothetical protein
MIKNSNTVGCFLNMISDSCNPHADLGWLEMIAYERIYTLGLRSAEVTLKRPLRCTTDPSDVSSTAWVDAVIPDSIFYEVLKTWHLKARKSQ